MGREIRFFSAWILKASHNFIQEFDPTNFGERNRNQTDYDITTILHDLTLFKVTALSI